MAPSFYSLPTFCLFGFPVGWLSSQPSSCLCPTQGVYERCEVLLRPPFDACHAYVSPLPFTASCTSDLCQ